MNIPTTTEPVSIGVDHQAAWRNLTEDLIFAAAYYDDPRTRAITWLRCLDQRKIKYNPDDEERKCRELCRAINRLSFNLTTQIERAHAANEHKIFRIVNASLFPEMP